MDLSLFLVKPFLFDNQLINKKYLPIWSKIFLDNKRMCDFYLYKSYTWFAQTFFSAV